MVFDEKIFFKWPGHKGRHIFPNVYVKELSTRVFQKPVPENL